jgi:methionyl-tRNA formyltransferase
MSKSDPQSYLVVGSKSWNREVFDQILSEQPGRWHFVGAREDLTAECVKKLNPRYVFFLHWSSKVPNELIANHECVCFHMTDVPYGRGGSPLQNLIVRGHRTTKLTALRMSSAFDAGPVYLKEDLSLDGSAEEIYRRATLLSASMIERIIREKPQPVPQSGEVVLFKRRKPEESEIPALGSSEQLHNFIRMLDAEDYPRAFLNYKGFRFEFHQSKLSEAQLTARVVIKPSKEDEK